MIVKSLNTVFVSVYCLATVVLASLMAFGIQYPPKWETVYTLAGLSAMLLVGLLNVIAWLRKKARSPNGQEKQLPS